MSERLIPDAIDAHSIYPRLLVFRRDKKMGAAWVELEAGHYAFRLTVHRPQGAARLQLRWRSEHFGDEPISQFF